VLAGLFFRIDFLAIDADLEHAAAHWNQCELADVLFELQQLVRQTDGARFVVSNAAIFDFDFQTHCCQMKRKS
jgi:hypothetical protein